MKWFERLGEKKANELRALLRGEGGVLLDERLGECSAKLAKSDDKADDKRRKFEMTAYTGKRIFRFWGDMVIDMSGIERGERTAMLLEHCDSWPVAVAEDGGLEDGHYKLRGYMLSNAQNVEAQKLIANMDEGVPYKASVGIRFSEVSELEADAEAEVNGEKHRGPLTIVKRCQLFETSFLLNPADLDTEVEIMAAQLAATGSPKPPAPGKRTKTVAEDLMSPEQVAHFRAEAIKAELARANALSEAFPNRPKFVQKMLLAGKNVEQAKLADYDAQAEKNTKLKNRVAEFEQGQQTVADLKKAAKFAGPGFNTAERQNPGTARLDGLPLAERCKVEIETNPRLRAIFSRFQEVGGKPMDPAEAYRIGVEYSTKMRENGKPFFSPEKVASFAAFLKRECEGRYGPINAEEQLAAMGIDARLASAKGAPDYSLVTVNGFKGLFFPRFERALGSTWSRKVAFISDSDQITEIHRWIGLMPQMALWNNERQSTPMPVYQTTVSSLLYQAATQVDVTDFKLQKFGIISQRIGELGSIAAEHWDQLTSSLVEANPTGYDGVALYAANHALGGQAPAAQQNAFTKLDNGAFNPADPTNPSVQECVAIIMALIQPMYGFKFNNNTPANGSAREFVVVVPVNMMGSMAAALTVSKLNYGQDNPLLKQPYTVSVEVNPRATQQNVVRAFRTDCVNRGVIMQEPGPPEMLVQGADSYLRWFAHACGFAVESTRAVAVGDWLSTTQATLG